jgi:two-component system, cell cycle sensor histidine kinase and response regulator CckA
MSDAEPKQNRRILIVDDNPTIHEDFRKILCPADNRRPSVNKLAAALFDEVQPTVQRISFELDSAYQGQEGFEMVKKALAENRPYAMAFVDVRMPPGWDGVETIAHLWGVHPQLQIVVCTAYSDYSWEQLLAKVGQPDNLVILKKPCDNVEVQQLALALTRKWLLNVQADLKLADLEAKVAQRTAELVKANESLGMSEERFSKAFHSSPVPSGIVTLPERRFVDVNQRLADVTGYTRKEMIGHSTTELFIWEKPELADGWFERLSRQDLVQDEEANIRNQTGALREVLVSLAPVTMGGEPHVLLLVQDVSERTMLERQLRQAQKMEAIGRLAAGVAHDFNNILTVIQGHAGLLGLTLGSADDAPQNESLHQIAKASGRACSLIRQLLMFSRKQVMQFRNHNLNDIVRDFILMLRRVVGEQVRIDFRPYDSLPAIRADNSMVEQIVMNLAVNSRDAMPNGGTIGISTSLEKIHRAPTPMDPEKRDGEFVCLTFSDTGIGMDTQILGRIFEPFFTTKPVGKGTGLGLSTVFGIVQQHHGWLEVESKPGSGTTFRIFFAASGQPAEKANSLVDVTLRQGNETILVAEDEDALREMVVKILEIQGYSVLEASSGHHALEVCDQASRPIDLLLTDMIMPGSIMGGELAERLKAQSPGIKVIYTSGYSPGMAGKDISLLEGHNFLPKPYSIGKLAQLVRDCLDTPVKQN